MAMRNRFLKMAQQPVSVWTNLHMGANSQEAYRLLHYYRCTLRALFHFRNRPRTN